MIKSKNGKEDIDREKYRIYFNKLADYKRRIEFLIRTEKFLEAIELLQKAAEDLKNEDEPVLLELRCEVCFLSLDYDQAAQIIEKLVMLDQVNGGIKRAHLLFYREDFQESLKLCDSLETMILSRGDKERVDRLRMFNSFYGLVYGKNKGDFYKAVSVCNIAKRISYHDRITSLLYLGSLYLMSTRVRNESLMNEYGDNKKTALRRALSCYRSVLSLTNNRRVESFAIRKMIYAELSLYYSLQGKPFFESKDIRRYSSKEEIRSFKARVRDEAHVRILFEEFGYTALHLHIKLSEYERKFKLGVLLRPRDPFPFFEYARILARYGKYTEARKYFKLAAGKIQNNNTHLLIKMAKILPTIANGNGAWERSVPLALRISKEKSNALNLIKNRNHFVAIVDNLDLLLSSVKSLCSEFHRVYSCKESIIFNMSLEDIRLRFEEVKSQWIQIDSQIYNWVYSEYSSRGSDILKDYTKIWSYNLINEKLQNDASSVAMNLILAVFFEKLAEISFLRENEALYKLAENFYNKTYFLDRENFLPVCGLVRMYDLNESRFKLSTCIAELEKKHPGYVNELDYLSGGTMLLLRPVLLKLHDYSFQNIKPLVNLLYKQGEFGCCYELCLKINKYESSYEVQSIKTLVVKCMFRLKKHSDALKNYRLLAKELEEDDLQSYYPDLAEAYLATGNKEKGIEYFFKSVEYSPDQMSYFSKILDASRNENGKFYLESRAKVYFYLNSIERSLYLYQRILLSIDYKDGESLNRVAGVIIIIYSFYLLNLKAAKSYFKGLVEDGLSYMQTYVDGINCAISSIDEKTESCGQEYLVLAYSAVSVAKYNLAVDLCGKALDDITDPSMVVSIREILGLICSQQGKDKEAVGHFDAAERLLREEEIGEENNVSGNNSFIDADGLDESEVMQQAIKSSLLFHKEKILKNRPYRMCRGFFDCVIITKSGGGVELQEEFPKLKKMEV